MRVRSARWTNIRVMAGTILGGIVGFYVMHKVEISYKEKMKERLRIYELQQRKKEAEQQLPETLSDS